MKTTPLVKISVVVPVYNEEAMVGELHRKILAALNRQPEPYEIIFVNDGSTDGTEKTMAELKPLKVVALQKNCGQTAAIDAGIRRSKGEIIALLDADLQNDPEDLLRLLEKLSEGNDVVVGWRKERKDTLSRLLFSKIANAVARHFFSLPLHDFGCGLKVYRSRFIRGFHLWGQAQVFLPAAAKERGAKVCEMPVRHNLRKAGPSKISILKMMRGSFNVMRVGFSVKYLKRPLGSYYEMKSHAP